MTTSASRIAAIDAQLGERERDVFVVLVDQILPPFHSGEPIRSGKAAQYGEEFSNVRCIRDQCLNKLDEMRSWFCVDCRMWVAGVRDEDPLGIGEPRDLVDSCEYNPEAHYTADETEALLARHDTPPTYAYHHSWDEETQMGQVTAVRVDCDGRPIVDESGSRSLIALAEAGAVRRQVLGVHVIQLDDEGRAIESTASWVRFPTCEVDCATGETIGECL